MRLPIVFDERGLVYLPLLLSLELAHDVCPDFILHFERKSLLDTT